MADPRYWFYAVSGMDAARGLAWTWAARASCARCCTEVKEPRAGWIVLFACLVRPEFVLVAAGIVITALVKRRATLRSLLRLLAPALVGGIAYLALHWLWFGDPLPNTWWAKRAGDWTHVRIGLAYLAALAHLSVAARRVSVSGGAAVAAHRHRAGTGLRVLGSTQLVTPGRRSLRLPSPVRASGFPAAARWPGRPCRSGGESSPVAVRVVTAALTVAAIGTAIGARIPTGRVRLVRVAWRSSATHWRARIPPTHTSACSRSAPPARSVAPAGRGCARFGGPAWRGKDAFSRQHACALDIGHERGDPALRYRTPTWWCRSVPFSPSEFESLDEVREGFYRQKQIPGGSTRGGWPRDVSGRELAGGARNVLAGPWRGAMTRRAFALGVDEVAFLLLVAAGWRARALPDPCHRDGAPLGAVGESA